MKTVRVNFFVSDFGKGMERKLNSFSDEVGIFKSQPGTETRCSTIILKLYPKNWK